MGHVTSELNSFLDAEGEGKEGEWIPCNGTNIHTILQNYIDQEIPKFSSNNNGGILGGISTGQDLIVRFCGCAPHKFYDPEISQLRPIWSAPIFFCVYFIVFWHFLIFSSRKLLQNSF